ncbi:MAG: 2-dehydropantoate 2-reductase, partial [Deltaproteobacteria bacterium]|nr:2-dehydropantoate 2-reductase [Deltaproteobacteria bacterium]
MNILIVGPGAMGCLFAARLRKNNHNAALLDYRPERAALTNKKGIRVEGVTGEYEIHVPVVTGKTSEAPDIVLICVKANQTKEAAQGLKMWLGPEARILTLQNGFGNIETLVKIFGGEKVLGGVTSEGATLLAPGRIRHAGEGETVIGPDDSPGGTVAEIVSLFASAGFRARSAENVDDLIWGKLIINVGINALTAITRLKNGLLPEIEGTKAVLERAVHEAVTVARAKGINLPYSDPLERVLEVCRATSGNTASMLQDVLRQRETEVAYINGAIVREGKALGIPTPVNATLTFLVQAIQESY